MRICITATGSDLTSEVDRTFGRAAFFLFYDEDTQALESVANSPEAHGAGVQAAQLLAERKANAVITGHVGPNAYQGLAAANIHIYSKETGTVAEALADFRAGNLKRIEQPTAAPHRGGQS